MGAICGCVPVTDDNNQDKPVNIRKNDDNKKQSDNDIVTEYESSKRAIATAHFFGSVLEKYFNDPNCKCQHMSDDDPSFAETILSNMYVRGGALRDAMMNLPINDVDAVVDLKVLSEYHAEHLNKYHSNSSNDDNCILYKQYLNKFNGEHSKQELETMMNDKQGPDIVGANFLLNGRFIADIMLKNDDFRKIVKFEKIVIGSIRVTVYNFEIVESYTYNDIDLKGCVIDLADISHNNDDEIIRDINNKLDKYKSYNTLLIDKQYTDDYDAKDIGNDQYILPVYPDDLLNITKECDVTINAIILPFNLILKEELTIKKWREICSDPFVDQVNGKKDAQNKELRVWRDSVVSIDPGRHVYRIVKLYSKIADIRIDNSLLIAHNKLYDEWFTNEILMEKDNENVTHESLRRGSDFVIKYFLKMYVKKGQIERRFECLEIMGFHKRFLKILNENDKYNQKLQQGLADMKDEELKKDFTVQMKKYGYI